nr:GIY-YIG nuclease family protein [Candidatus Berkiella aquae]
MVKTANGSLYTGVATDVKRRFSEHQTQGNKCAKYLRGKGPLELVYQETIGDKSDAHKREHEIKQFSKAQKLALIK